MGKGIVLGRFQPFHKGHAHLVEHALANFDQITIAVGSAQEEWTVDNPFSVQERIDMIEAWATHNQFQDKITIVGIEDIHDLVVHRSSPFRVRTRPINPDFLCGFRSIRHSAQANGFL